ncbi:xanthine dehydrogenase family protein molybdopterin-binding subunit [Dyadobacter sp. CY312]|uniref:xanthine dehydrogenase family protein molybdopterin-binding subunit n=1 Tax=Dyadobacter sp. CY312 TaxID=2907303 RepID=UPI001F29D592|nr:xanthine dehydrogenase family protein molybdopterin-binding subunit [Dyadobacter sp. CY312]MCE7044561.1 xanthine dehydrogenase family protein molybdopterin-binding subunit [Dyadobacter sp. CY312]
MAKSNDLNRREFIKTGSLASAFILSFQLPLPAIARGKTNVAARFAPNAFISISEDNSVKILCNHSEMGQGTYTAMTQLIAEEMDADWSKITVEPAPADATLYSCPAFGMQLTGGSASSYGEWDRLRKVGASARDMLLQAATKVWGVEIVSCRTDNGYVVHSSGKKLAYGELVTKMQGIQPKNDSELVLKDPKDFKYIGKSVKRVEALEKVNGSGKFGMDVSIPGMLVAVVERPPVFGSKVKSFNADKSKSVPGVKHVVQIDRGIAVVATGYWAARKGREVLEVDWDLGPLLNTQKQREQYLAMSKTPGLVATKEGDVSKVHGAAKTIAVLYEFPYLNHAQMEPLNATADVRKDGCDIYIGTQAQTFEQMTAAQILGMKPEQIKVHTQLLGGAFGRRSVFDGHIAAEAVQTSRAVGAPVKVMWSREDDLKGGYYRTVSLHQIKGSIGAANNPVSWHHRVVCQSFMIGSPMEKMAVKNGVDSVSVEGASELHYDIPNIQVEWHQGKDLVPTLWMRSVGHSYNAYVKECFMDELAFAAGKDPYLFRKAMMKKEPRLLGVLDAVAKKSGWGKPLPAGHARGIAVHASFESFTAQVAEVSISPDGKPKVHKVWLAIDCGPVINPDKVRAQMEGSVIFGLTSALYGKLTFKDGRVQQNNFYDYKMVRMDDAPPVDVTIIESPEKMGGVGEPGVPCTAPAVANALFTLTKKRIRKLPFPADVRKA